MRYLRLSLDRTKEHFHGSELAFHTNENFTEKRVSSGKEKGERDEFKDPRIVAARRKILNSRNLICRNRFFQSR